MSEISTTSLEKNQRNGRDRIPYVMRCDLLGPARPARASDGITIGLLGPNAGRTRRWTVGNGKESEKRNVLLFLIGQSASDLDVLVSTKKRKGIAGVRCGLCSGLQG